MRPVGGLTIGYVGDRYGRKKALVLSLFLMAFPTALMGCLPTYEQVGALSTILLVVCRLLQGMSVGGQLPASLIYTVEIRPKAHWGYYGALVMMASNCGTLLGNLVGALMRAVLTDEQLIECQIMHRLLRVRPVCDSNRVINVRFSLLSELWHIHL